MADDRSDADVVRAVLQHLAQEMEQGRPARDVLREIWLEATAALLAARQQGRGDSRIAQS